MSDVFTLYEVPPIKQINQSTVETLTDFLTRAQNGELNSVAIAATCSDGTVMTVYSEVDDLSRLVGSLEVLKFRLLDDREPIE